MLLFMGWACHSFITPTVPVNKIFIFCSDPYVKVTLKRRNKSLVTEQSKKKKKVGVMVLIRERAGDKRVVH